MSLVLALMLGQAFQQGPMKTGHREHLSGVVIGARQQDRGACALVLADQTPVQPGAGGRFILCTTGIDDPAILNTRISGSYIQVDTGLWRVGPRLRVLPLYQSSP